MKQTTKIPGVPEVGKCYFIRTVTDYWVGRLAAIQGPFAFTLKESSWIPDTGRLSEFMKEGKAEGMAVEPVGEVTCQWLSYLPWPHPLFTKAE